MKPLLSCLVITLLSLAFTTQSAETPKSLKLQFGKEKEIFEYPISICKEFATLNNVVEDLCDDHDEPIPLPNIAGKELFEQIIAYSNTPADQRSDFLRNFNNQAFQELFEAFNFLDYQESEEAVFGPFIRKILNDQRKLQSVKITEDRVQRLMQQSPDNLSLLDWFFHPYSGNYGRFTLITHSDIARKIHGEFLTNRALAKGTTPKELLRHLHELAKNPTKKNLGELGVIINFIHNQNQENSASGGYACNNFGITHLPPEEVSKIVFTGEGFLDCKLSLNGNALRTINTLTATLCPNLAHLQFLSVSANHITELPPLDLPNLLSLNLSDNRIKSFTDDSFHGLPKLQRLNLSDNCLTELPQLDKLSRLKTFLAASNQLTTLSELAHCPQLEIFDVTSNQLTVVDWSVVAQRLPKLEKLNISFNQFEWQIRPKHETDEQKRTREAATQRAKIAIFEVFKEQQKPLTLRKITLS